MGKKEAVKGGTGAGRGSKSGGNTKGAADTNTDDVKREQKLQAILLADSFAKTFRPITWNYPKVLLPLVNAPMLEYTIEFLAQNGVEEIFIFCVWHAKILEEYINSSRWTSIVSVRCINSASCRSAGDALRELDALGIIRSDPFVLISGDVVSNMDLKKAIEFHKSKRKIDNNAIMTVVLKEVQPNSGAKPILTDLIVACDHATSQILLFEDSRRRDSIHIPVEIMNEHFSLAFRTDLLDCHIDICSPELMLQFSDNFDYQDIRRDFIKNEAVNWELGMHIYGYKLQNEYAARVHDPRTYHCICRDIVTRWVYPLVPDAQLLRDSSYTHLARYVYKEVGTRVNRTARVGEGVVIGRGTIVEGHAKLERSILGRNCFVGPGAIVEEAHLWEGARVEESAFVSQAIVGFGAVVRKSAIVGRGCMLSSGVVVGEAVRLPDFCRVSLSKRLNSEPSLSDVADYDFHILGKDGRGYVWSTAVDDIDDDIDEADGDDDEECNDGAHVSSVDAVRAHSIGCKEELAWKISFWDVLPEPVVSDDDDDDDYDDEDSDGFDQRACDPQDETLIDTYRINGQDRQGTEILARRSSAKKANAALDLFCRNVEDMIITARGEGHPADNVLMEIKGYKFAQNKTFSDCLRGAVEAVIKLAMTAATSPGAVFSQIQFLGFLKDFFKAGSWGYNVLKSLSQGETEELAIIEAVEAGALQAEREVTLYPVFRMVLQLLYDADLVSEEALLQWIEEREELAEESGVANIDPRVALFQLPQVKAFVEWVKEDDDDDDGDD